MSKKDQKVGANVSISLYEMNKQLMVKEPLLTKEEIDKKVAEVVDMIDASRARAWMLLCNERQDYTIFLHTNHVVLRNQLIEDLKETILNRGDLVSIDKQENGSYEIWIKDNNECFCYILFDYSNAIIDY